MTWIEESGTASGSSHLSGHPKDPEKECITGAVCIQECFKGCRGWIRDAQQHCKYKKYRYIK